MSRTITRFHLRNSVFAVTALGLLAGCDESGNFVAMQAFKPNTEVEGTPVVGRSTETVERDVEAPEVFSANEAGLWDGRPSLGGVWVAHPDVTEPERVIIRNSKNDKFVVGALFRRERDIPGPRLQISSDAAEALGMLAGAPSQLNVTALRKEEVAEPVEEIEEIASVDGDIEGVAAPSEVTATPLDPIASAAAAIDAASPSIQPAAAKAAASGIQPAAVVDTSAPGIQPAVKPKATPAAAAAPARAASSSLAKPFIQIGIFSVQENADRTAKQMRSAGIVPLVKSFDRDGKTFWRVVVGPASSGSDRALLLSKVKDEGFTDAYAVSN